MVCNEYNGFMKLESRINFRVGDRVKINPDNHGYKFLRSYEKVRDMVGTVKVVEMCLLALNDDEFNYVETGVVSVEWDYDYGSRKYDYRRLRICL